MFSCFVCLGHGTCIGCVSQNESTTGSFTMLYPFLPFGLLFGFKDGAKFSLGDLVGVNFSLGDLDGVALLSLGDRVSQ